MSENKNTKTTHTVVTEPATSVILKRGKSEHE